MSELENMNAEATKQALALQDKKLNEMEHNISVLINQVQTLNNLVVQLQQSNNLALATLRGTGATNGNIN